MLHVHRSERADLLVDALGDLLSRPDEEVMAREVVSVPTRGVERWLTQRLSSRLGTAAGRGDGVCANVEFPFPGTLIGRASAQACEIDPEADPWPPERSVWPLVEVIDEHLGEPFMAPIRRHLEAVSPSGDALRRYPTARHLADLYDRYAVNRPDLLEGWAAGSAGWGVGGDDTEAWQAELWRLLQARIGVPGPAERYSEAALRIEAKPELVDLPRRISMFGLTRLPASHLRVLKALAAGRDVHLFLLHPSPALWDEVEGALPTPSPRLRRADDTTSALAANPLLRSWGRDAREMQLVLEAQGVGRSEHRSVPVGPSTLLGRIQDDVHADRAPGAQPHDDELVFLADDDDSLRVHSCHGKARQVEVMRDAVLHLLADDETLEPRDVVIMCPDIETFAPLVAAAFGTSRDEGLDPAHASDDTPSLRVRLADRSIRQTNPLLAVAARLLALAGGRTTASDVLDLAASEAVGRRFRFDDEDLARIARWIADSGVRWGLDAERRSPWHLEDEPANTWASGLDRLLLGAAMSEEGLRLFGGVLPFDDIAENQVDLLGRLAELVDRLRAALDSLTGRRSVASWMESIAEATESLAVSAPHESWQHDQLRRLLDDVATELGASGPGPELDLAEITDLLEDRLKGRPTRANFRTGDLTVCTLVPMRSVPHRVIGLLGLDDGVFPRDLVKDGDNLLLEDPRVGERDPRTEDRQLLLDALLAAGEHLIITYEGHDLRTNQPRPPSVPLAELLDVVDTTVRLDEPGARPRDRVIVEHPLQSFDPRNFEDGCLGEPGPFGFDPMSLAGARARVGPKVTDARWLCGPLPPADRAVVQLEALVKFLHHPVKAFLRERLGLYLGGEDEPVRDEIPVDLDALELWGVGDRLLEARLGGLSLELARDAERARGSLPPGHLADAALDKVVPAVEQLARVVEDLGYMRSPAESLPVHVELPDDRLLVGAVSGVRDGIVVRVGYSKLKAKHRLEAWARFLALSASLTDRSISAVTVGRADRAPVCVAKVATLDPDPRAASLEARELLGTLVDLYDRGLREPLPLYCDTSAAWAEAAAEQRDPQRAARGRWETKFGSMVPGEDQDVCHVEVLGAPVSLGSLLENPPAAGETGPGWRKGPSRLEVLAHRLWDPILEHETQSSP